MARRIGFAPEDLPENLLEGEEIQLSVLYFISSFSFMLWNKIIHGRGRGGRRKRISQLQNDSPGKDEEKICKSSEDRDGKISVLTKIATMENELNSYKSRWREMKTALDSIKNDLESSRAIEAARESQIDDLQQHILDIAEAKTLLEEKNNSLLTEINECREENGRLQNRIMELEIAVICLDDDRESKDVLLRELRERLRELTEPQHQPLQVLQSGKPKCVNQSENGKSANGAHEKRTQLNGVAEKNTPSHSMADKRTPNGITEK